MPFKNLNKRKEYLKQYRKTYAIKQADKIKAYNDEYVKTHKNEITAARQKRISKNPDKYKEVWLKRVYGITIKQYNKMLEEQNGVCEICLQPETRKRNGKICLLSVDHNHITGKNRGLLCFRCNLGIGYLKDDNLIIKSAANYLIKYTSK